MLRICGCLVVAALSLGVVACDTANTPNLGNGATPVPVVVVTPAPVSPGAVADKTVIDEQLMYAAEALYNVPAHAYVTADGKGQLPADRKAKLKPLMIKAYDALLAARKAYKLANSPDFFAAYANLKDLSNQAKALLPKA